MCKKNTQTDGGNAWLMTVAVSADTIPHSSTC